MHALKTTFEILKKHSPRVLPLCFASVLSDQAILETLTSTVMQAKINFYLLGFWGMLSLVSAMVWPALIGIVVVSLATQNKNLLSKQNFNQVMIEMTRAYGSSLLWGLLFILPGFHRYFQYLGVPFVVLLDPDYSVGKKDALMASRRLTNKYWKKIFGFSIVAYLICPLFFYLFFSDGQLIWKTPVSGSLYVVLQGIFITFISVWLTQIYSVAIDKERKSC